MNFKSVKEILTAIKNKDVSVIELTSNYLDKIKERADALNCFITLTEEFALNKARKIFFVLKILRHRVALKCLIIL